MLGHGLLFAAAVAAEPSLPPPAEELPSATVEARVGLGLGASNLGVAARLGIGAEFWFLDHVGAGLFAGRLAHGNARPLEAGVETSVNFIGPLIAFRSSPQGSHAFGTLGASYAAAKRTEYPGFCIDFVGGGCLPNVVTHYSAYGLHASGGFVWQGKHAPLEVGPVLRLDLFRDTNGAVPVDYVVTANAELGLWW